MNDKEADAIATWLATKVIQIIIIALFVVFILAAYLFRRYPRFMGGFLGVTILLFIVGAGISWIGQMLSHPSNSYTPPATYTPTATSNSNSTHTEASSGSISWQIRLYNMDEHGEAYLNGSLIASVDYRPGDTGWVDISDKVQPGDNTLHLLTRNESGGYAWGFDIA